MNRRIALAWRWTVWSGVALAAATGAAMWLAREDTRPVDPGSRDVAGLTDDLARRLPADCPKLRFSDQAPRLGLPAQFVGPRTRQLPEDMGGGIALADLDGDGDPDLVVVGCGALPGGGPTRLFRNDTAPGGPVAFTDVTADAGLPGPLPGMGAAVADADGDGDLDLLLTTFGGVRLLRNEGGLRFLDVTEDAGLGVASKWCSGAAFGDIDGDGDLDLYVARYVDYRHVAGRADLPMYGRAVPWTLNPSSFQPLPNLLFRNRGDGTFEGGEDLARALGIDNPTGRSLGCVFADFDLDGLPDLYVANDVSDNVMLRGVRAADGARGFEDVSYASATADYRGAMGLAVGDPDRDGDDDLFVSHWLAQENAYYENKVRDARLGSRPMLFMDVADRVGLGAVALDSVGWAADFADLDLDGRPDLFVADGSTIERDDDRTRLETQRPLLFWNGGDRGFFEPGAAWGDDPAKPRGFRGGAAADLDGDGDLDLVFGSLEGPPAVLVNEGPPRGRSLAVELRAPAPDTFGIGARVTVVCGGCETSREMRSSPGYLSGGPPVLVFGLGASADAAKVRVRWPDGTTTETDAAPGERRVTVRR